MKSLDQKQLIEFLNQCDVDYDIYNYDQDIAYLRDDQGEEVITLNFDTSSSIIPNSIWIGDDEFNVTDQQKSFIHSFLWKKTESDRADKLERKKEVKEVPYHYLEN